MGDSYIFQRYEIKYLISKKQKAEIIRAMQPHMIPDPHGHGQIFNVYFDTPDFRLIRRSLERPVYKEKLRMRSYGPAGLQTPVFLELKKKYRSVVYKRRISLPQDQAMEFLLEGKPLKQSSQIGNEITYARDFYQNLQPAVFLSYERDAFFSETDGSFRMTFDDDIRFRQERCNLHTGIYGTPILREDQALLEVKTAGGMPLWLTRLLSDMEIRKTSFSKYGTAYRMIKESNHITTGEILYA